ncbi:MAG: fibrobacter succinogenes major paralogous domain-containing protein [Candidatus Kapabacteria bacterium]|nr:fibrobacter succinogenes major paralogous domain-containing protein [Candidatus Kapabacteria bacterium]
MNHKIFILSLLAALSLMACGNDNPTNSISNTIDTVKIGNQIWMKKNLDVDHYRNGDPIPEAKDSALWANLTTGAWCYYNNDPANGKIYGKLYNWYAVNDPRGLAPSGWHVPSDSEWKILENYLGGDSIVGDKLKEKGTSHWISPNTGATNESGFTGLPGGGRNYDGTFEFLGQGSLMLAGIWWSSSLFGKQAIDRYIGYHDSRFIIRTNDIHCGLSIRCIKD